MKTKFEKLYFYFLFIFSTIAIVLFSFVFLCRVLPTKLTPTGLDGIVSYIQSLSGIINAVFLILFVCPLFIMMLCSVFGKHSIGWHIKRFALLLFIPLYTLFMINVLNANIDMMSLFVGVVSGVISAVIVLVLDRNNDLVKSLLRVYAPDLIHKENANNDHL